LLVGAEPAVVIRVEAAERDHPALEAHALHDALGLTLLLTVELAVVVLVEALEHVLAAGAMPLLVLLMLVLLRLLRRRRRRSLCGSRRDEPSDEGEGENDSLHAVPTRRRAER
jgi:hypothetical protein